LKKSRNVVVAFSSTGRFSDGTWNQALSAAAAKVLPIIFVRRDKLSKQTGNARSGSVEDYGFPRIPVDGHDVVAVYRVAHESIQRARRGGGPTLIECEPYLPDTHGRNGLGRPGAWRMEKDPIRHMEMYLTRKGLFRDSWKDRLVAEFSRKFDAAIDAAKQE
jgi:pyruvate dehydrogenase E1 component alpha subunit